MTYRLLFQELFAAALLFGTVSISAPGHAQLGGALSAGAVGGAGGLIGSAMVEVQGDTD